MCFIIIGEGVNLLPEEGWEGGEELIVGEGGEGLEEDEPLAAGVTGGPVDVQLVLLVLYHKLFC